MRSGQGLRGVAFVLCLIISAASAADDAGAALFQTNCSICHQLAGQGVPGQFPRLAGRLNVIAANKGGRDYLATVLLNGMSGGISVDGTALVGVMPPFAMLSDAMVAQTLNHVLRFDMKAKTKAFTAEEIAEVRKRSPVAPSLVHDLRQSLNLDGLNQ